MSVTYDLDFRQHPECYTYESNEKGVFKVQPYKDELLPLWQFKDETAAREAIDGLRAKYDAYKADEDFVGMDMARKYLQMGFTRAMRYAKYPGGQKYDADGTPREPQQWADDAKRAAALLFKAAWQAVLDDADYERLKNRHRDEVYDPGCGVMD